MNIGLYITISNAKTGKVEKTFKANSLVNAFAGILCAGYSASLASAGITVQDTGGTNRNLYSSSAYQYGTPRMDAGAGVTTYGIVVGSGSSAVTVSDYQLGTLIAHGTGAGQLTYGAVELPANFTISGSDAYFRFSRTLTNGSGGNVTINEIGLYGRTFATTWYFLIDRTLSTVVLADTDAKVITYEFKVTV